MRTCAVRLAGLATLVLLAAGAAFGQQPASEFTTTDPGKKDKVKIIEDSAREKEPHIDHFKHLCPGLGGDQARQGTLVHRRQGRG